MIKEPKSASEAFVQKQEAIKKRGNAIDIGMGVGNALTNACNIVVALIGQDPSKSLDEKEIEEQIKKWVDKIYRIGQEKKDYESIPVVDTEIEIIPEPIHIDDPPREKWAKPKNYNRDSDLEDTKVEEEMGKDLPF